jgi:alkylated DNA repair dioxygenase AlkB
MAQELPPLTRLSLQPAKPRSALKPGRETEDGVYCLDCETALTPCTARVILYRKAVPLLPGEFAAAVRVMTGEDVPQQMCMGRPVPRQQATFGPVKYKTYPLLPLCAMPLAQRLLEATRVFAAQLGDPHPEQYTGVHVNYYADGDCSVMRHSDDERQLVPGARIFSYTYLESDLDRLARDFTIWKKAGCDAIEGKGKIARVTLYSGDLIIMDENMQETTEHSIEKVKSCEVAPRLNFTVRKFVSMEEANAAAKRKAPGGP